MATSAPAISQAPNPRTAVASTIKLATGFPLPFTVHLFPDAFHQLRELTGGEPRFPTEHHQLPGPFDDALVVAIGERRRALRLRRDRGSQAALQAEQPFLLEIAIDAGHRVGVEAEG